VATRNEPLFFYHKAGINCVLCKQILAIGYPTTPKEEEETKIGIACIRSFHISVGE